MAVKVRIFEWREQAAYATHFRRENIAMSQIELGP
jgi:hypothetical protein